MNAKQPWICLDIETRGGRPEDAPKWVRENWWPNERLVDASIGKAFREVMEETKTRMGLLDSAGIATVQLQCPDGAMVLHTFPVNPMVGPTGSVQAGYATERDMLIALRTFLGVGKDDPLGQTDDATTLVGWNIKGFDLRRLRFAYLRAGLNVPRALRVQAGVYDMMKEYVDGFSVDRQPFVKLEVALEAFGMPNHKAQMDGSQVDVMIRAGQYDKVLAYAWADIAAETELFLRMTGQSKALA